ncbi:ferric reductase-like transmembrane domain-containing protein, partial [Vibrio rotiferianus]
LPVVENWLHGMDKAHRIHKWLGIAGASLGVVHWLWYKVPKWLVEVGVLEKPAKHQNALGINNFSNIEAWFHSLKELGKSFGEIGFYLLLILVAISLWGVVKYKPFRLSHRLMSVVYLLIAVHSVLLI